MGWMGWGGYPFTYMQSFHLEAIAAKKHNAMASLSVRQSNPQGSIPGHSQACATQCWRSHSVHLFPGRMCIQSSCLVSRLYLWIICVAVTVPGEKQTSLFPPQIKHQKQTKGHFTQVWFSDPVSLPGLTGAQSNPKIAVLPRGPASMLTSQSCRDGIFAPLQPTFHLLYILGPPKTI